MNAQKNAGWRDAAVNDAGRVVGQWHHRAKLTDDDIELILDLRASGMSYRQIAAKFDDDRNVTKSQVHRVCTHRGRAHTTMGHKRVPLPRGWPADPGEFD